MHAIIRLLSFITILVVTIAPGARADTGGRLVGHVVDENFEPLEGALITVSGTGAVGVYTSRTDAEGRYSILGLPMNEALIVRGQAPGKIEKVYAGIWVRRNQDTERDFRLRPPGHHEILVLFDPDNPLHRLALEGARATLPGSIVERAVKGRSLNDQRLVRYEISHMPNAVVTIGRDASFLARREARQTPMVFLMVPDPYGDRLVRSNSCGIGLNDYFSEQLDRLAEISPETHDLVTVFDPRRLGGILGGLRRAAKDHGMTLTARSARNTEQVGRALDALRSVPADAFYLLADPEFFDEQQLGLIREFVEERHLIYLVPDTYFFQMGGNLTDAPGFRTMGEETGLIIRNVLGGRSMVDMGIIRPEKRTFAVAPDLEKLVGSAPAASDD